MLKFARSDFAHGVQGIASPSVLPAKQQSRDNALGVSLPAEQHAGAPASSSHGAASTSTGLAKPPALEPPLKCAARPCSCHECANAPAYAIATCICSLPAQLCCLPADVAYMVCLYGTI